MTGTNRKSKADGNIASWKFRLEDTINADPDAPKAGLKVIRVYLHSYGEDNPYPYAAMSTLMAKTGLTAPTIRATRDKLVELGYLVERGVSADGKAAGATMYELRNPREAYVQKLVEERLRTFRDEAKERMRSHRAKDAAADVTAKNFPNTDDDTEACVRKETFRMFGKKFSECYSKKFTPNTGNNSGDNTVGAAHAAPHEGKGSDNNIRGGGPLRGRPPTGDRDEYPAAEKNPNPAGSQKQDDERERVLQAFELVKRRLNILNDPKREFVSEFQAKLDAGEPLTEADMDRLWKVYDFAFPQDEAGLMAVTEIPF